MIEHIRIRCLTPRECFRLMGQKDNDIDKLMEVEPSKNQQYLMAGNSIVVDVLVYIFQGIYIEKTFTTPKPKQRSITSWTEEK